MIRDSLWPLWASDALASLEKKMACGLGACLGCTCHTKIGPVTVCKDGPVFNAQEVFD